MFFGHQNQGNILNMIGNPKCPLSAEQLLFRRVFKRHRLASMPFTLFQLSFFRLVVLAKLLGAKNNYLSLFCWQWFHWLWNNSSQIQFWKIHLNAIGFQLCKPNSMEPYLKQLGYFGILFVPIQSYPGYQRFFSRAVGIFGVGRRPTHLRRRPKPRAAKPREKAFRAGHYKDGTETGNRARKVSGTQGNTILV